jgi:hypothetical protein
MERVRARTKRPLCLQRHFERSRLEGQLIAGAYELAIPLRCQALPSPSRPGTDGVSNNPSPISKGVSA